MFKTKRDFSIVTAILPDSTAERVISESINTSAGTAMSWQSRGTLLRDHWLSRFMPPIGPAKKTLQMIVPASQVDNIVTATIDAGRLHRQATGAVFSTPCEHAYVGSEFQTWPEHDAANGADHGTCDTLHAIICNVGQTLSDRVARAAVEAGAHGPVIHFCEGRGLRDRIGWLRVTKEHLQESQLVVVDESQVDDVFDAMAKAGGFHLPGRGLMYQVKVDKGLFNLPSSYAKHRHDANMQQIIQAIDHLSGDSHWRDQSVLSVGGQGRVVGVDGFKESTTRQLQRVELTGIVRRDQLERFVDLVLDSGAPGLNMTFGRFVGNDEIVSDGVRLHEEHCVVRSIVAPTIAARICSVIDETAEELGVRDLCVMVTPIERTATYVPSNIDYRNPQERSVA